MGKSTARLGRFASLATTPKIKILGVDPGLQVTGYGVISLQNGADSFSEAELLEAGVIRTSADEKIGERLRKIFQGLSEVITELSPDALVIEKLYAHYDHPATAILMGHARGVVCLLSGIHDIPLTSIPSTHVKKSVSGRGHAAKGQVQRMVQHALRLKAAPEPPDVADALAVALSYASQLSSRATPSKRSARGGVEGSGSRVDSSNRPGSRDSFGMTQPSRGSK